MYGACCFDSLGAKILFRTSRWNVKTQTWTCYVLVEIMTKITCSFGLFWFIWTLFTVFFFFVLLNIILSSANYSVACTSTRISIDIYSLFGKHKEHWHHCVWFIEKYLGGERFRFKKASWFFSPSIVTSTPLVLAKRSLWFAESNKELVEVRSEIDFLFC